MSDRVSHTLATLIDSTDALLGLIHTWAGPIILLATRIYIGLIFFKSGWLALSPWDSNLFLYEFEYIPNISKNLGLDISFISPGLMAIAGTAGELILPVLLWAGLSTRFAAFGLLCITGVIQLTYPEHGGTHYAWMLILGLLIARGGGPLTLDAVIGPRLGYTSR